MPIAKALRRTTAYEDDILVWSIEQAALLRAGRFTQLDLENLAEEIEDVGRSEKRELASRMAVLLAHLLKWSLRPGFQSASWRATIIEQRRKVALRLQRTPSLKALCLDDPLWVEEIWLEARSQARMEMGLDRDPFGPVRPFGFEQAIEPDFFPD